MNDLIKINNTDITVKEYQGKRVVTLKEIDQCHNRPEGTASRNFRNNRQHFVEGEDYFIVKPSDIQNDEIRRTEINNRGTVLITESGYLMLVKSFTDDLAWDVQRQLVNSYFRVEQKKADETLKLQIQKERSRAMLINANYRMLKLLMNKPELQKLSPIALEALGIKAAEQIANINLSEYLPKTEKTYSASEVGNAYGISANKVGKIANAHGLKTEEYGVFVMDKSRYSSKEVASFRYNEKGKAEIGRLIGQTG